MTHTPHNRRYRLNKPLAWAALLLIGFAMLSGCGGGGGGGTAASSANTAAASCGAGCVLRPAASATVGPYGATLSSASASLTASLAATQIVTLYEKFYVSGRPGGIAGTVVDIQPDGIQFANGGATLCLSYAGTGLDGSSLAVYTGGNLDQPLPSWNNAVQQKVCATLEHASPYGLKLAQSLSLREFSIFGSLDAKEKHYNKITTTSGTDDHGDYTETRIHVECNRECMEDGDRFFRFYTGENNGDLYIRDNGTIRLWRDAGGMKYSELYSSDGAVTGGIAYLLALQYMKYFTGSGAYDATIALLDPSQNAIQRFITYDPDSQGFDRYTSITRDGNAITVNVRNDGSAERTFAVDLATAGITKSVAGQGAQSALPASAEYTALQKDLLQYLNEVIGLDDTPDQTAGEPYDPYVRITPLQELFAINVRNLIAGYGWNNLEAIEAYYRDRLNTMPGA
jgi:hypothetical protein